MEEASSNVKSYSKLAELNDNRAYDADTGEELCQEGDWCDTEILYKRAVVYSGAAGVFFVAFLSFAAGLYSFQSIRLANIAFSIAFIGLLLFVTLSA